MAVERRPGVVLRTLDAYRAEELIQFLGVKRLQGARVVDALDTIVLRLGMAIAGLIAIGIVLVVLEANQDNFIVDFFTSIAEFFTAPFDDIFELENRDGRIALNWGVGAAVYVVLGVVIAGLIGRFAKRSAE